MQCVSDCVAGRIRPGVPQSPEWQRAGDQIDAAMIFARSDFVNVHEMHTGSLHRLVRCRRLMSM
jgi:hypothetical protein